ALEGASGAGAAVEKIVLNELCLKPCQGCYGCAKGDPCVIRDDMRLVYGKLDKADGIMIASPIYFGSVTAQLKTMIDRFEPYWVLKHVLKRPAPGKRRRNGIFLCCAGEEKPLFFRNAKDIIRFLFNTLDIEYLGDIFCGGLERSGAVSDRPDLLKRSFKLGEELAKI
ncbi:MAG: flavodoxin family protein, partial [Candidatus Omnitrophica bacterium]|nr:flavodoxin family protein [Candidatus Omnitrophota bacterium]